MKNKIRRSLLQGCLALLACSVLPAFALAAPDVQQPGRLRVADQGANSS